MDHKEYVSLVELLTYKIIGVVKGHNANAVLNSLANALGNCIAESQKESHEPSINLVNKTVREVVETRVAKRKAKDEGIVSLEEFLVTEKCVTVI